MNVSLAKDLSVYQLVMGVQAPPKPLSLSPATLLSLVRAQIDLLIEQQIAATLWVKLPPDKIWQSELARYQSSVGASSLIYTCQIEESRKGEAGGDEGAEGDKGEEKVNTSLSPLSPSSSLSPYHIPVHLPPDSQMRRENFLMVLSPQFCSLILAHRPLKKRKNQTSGKVNTNKNQPLLIITTVEGRVIQQVLNSIQQAIAPESSSILPASFICPTVPQAALMNQLLAKQLLRQDEINRQIITVRTNKLEQQNQELHNKEQLKDEYLKNVCQELRIPLTHMKTALSLLNSPNLKPPQRQRYLQMLNTQCDQQNSLINGFLELVQLEQNLEGTTLELVRLSDIVPGVVSTYQPVAQEKGIMLAYTVPTELPSVWCVSGKLRQIVINLLHNSLKFTPNGGQVWVRARSQGDYVQLEFRDTGIGIAENEIPKIFDRFYRVRTTATEDYGGAGLGLTIVQQLLLRCGGSISVKSKLSEGSTFTVQLATAGNMPRAIATENEL
ncbi:MULTISPECIES: DICT sensory domain-containing protein [unclassified Nostoc]|uniref:DICT sensory domain-containing protein n=1 Tax=unclassified Nostoc TaxID=2593658 RepID=UPI0025AAB00F|nr:MULTISPECIES: DICT sensory domain-containing protein [unclassified Nostoc]MDM9582593.1 DICT sensory domain-containing protein [Nostoc sp. GT001]MDZ7943904.1 DICT sensory domain-containing protein [Nostoc sp. EfeVER01]MDZ7992258.1 DICT sensory domain-containing protein [Nostoc sp. EspVER01]